MGEEVEFAAELKKRAESGGGKIKVVDVAKKESEIEVKEMISLHDVIEGLKEKFPGLTHNRIPVCNSASPLEPDFDALCTALIGTNMNLRRTRTHSSVANSKLSGNSLPLSPKEMPPNVNVTRSLTKTDLLPRVPVSNNCARTLPNPSSATRSWTMPLKLSSKPKSWTTS